MNIFRKIFLLFALLSVIALNSSSQPSWVRGDFGTGWSDCLMIDRGVMKATAIQATTTNAATGFVYTRDLSYSPKWCGSLTDYTRTVNQVMHDASYYYVSGGWDHDLNISITNGNYYTFITTKNTSSNNDISILETIFQPVNIVNVTRTPSGNPVQGTPVLVDVTLSAAKDTAEHIFLRWTNDNWISSTFQEITSFNGAFQGSTTITGQPTGTNVSFYILSTIQTTPADSTIDFFTLSINNNTNANYGYTAIETTGCPFSFSFGNDTMVCGGAGMLLDPGITVSPYGDTLTITYDATTGQSGLSGAPKVYMHAGAELHTNGGWQYVTGNWGIDDGIGQMTNIGSDLWQIKINPVTYFGYPADSILNGILMVFRNDNGSLTGKDDLGNDIWVNMKTSPPVSSFYGVSPAFLKNNYDSISWSTGVYSQTLLVVTSGTYSCTIFNSSGGCTYADSVNVTVNPIPYVNIGNDQVLCIGDSVTLTANPSTFQSYSWSTGAATSSVTVYTDGLYSLTVTESTGCTGFDVVNISFVDPPVAGFSYSAAGMTIHFTDLSTGGTSYSWDFNGNGTVESTVAGDVTYTYAVPGQYNVILIVSNGCSSDTVNQTIFVMAGIEENLSETYCKVYPNPTTGKIIIDIDNPSNSENSEWMFEIYDITGNKIYSDKWSNQSAKITKSIDLSAYSSGIYLLKVKSDHSNFTRKIIVK